MSSLPAYYPPLFIVQIFKFQFHLTTTKQVVKLKYKEFSWRAEMTSFIAKLLKVLNSETDPSQISLAFCLSMIMGFTPLFSLHNIIILLVTLLLRVNLTSFILGLAVFSGLSYLLDPLFHIIGLSILTAAPLEGLWTTLYNTTIFRLAHFNNTILMGSLITSLVLFIPLFLILNILIRKYREHFLAYVEKSKIMQLFKATKIYKAYQSIQDLRG